MCENPPAYAVPSAMTQGTEQHPGDRLFTKLRREGSREGIKSLILKIFKFVRLVNTTSPSPPDSQTRQETPSTENEEMFTC